MNEKPDRMIKKEGNRGTTDLTDLKNLHASVSFSGPVFSVDCTTSDKSYCFKIGTYLEIRMPKP